MNNSKIIINMIRDRRKELNMSQRELARLTGINNSTLSRYENFEREFPINDLPKFAKALKLNLNYLLGIEEKKEENHNTIDLTKYDNIFPVTKKKIPLLGEIACGEPIFANEDRESYIEVGTDIKADFCLKCKGDSMINVRINPGDIVFIKKQSIVENGEIAAVIIEDTATLKRVFYHKNNIIELRAENPKYQSMIYTNEELEKINILGKAIAFQSDVP